MPVFESSESYDTETNILRGPFLNISGIVGISRGTSCISLNINAY